MKCAPAGGISAVEVRLRAFCDEDFFRVGGGPDDTRAACGKGTGGTFPLETRDGITNDVTTCFFPFESIRSSVRLGARKEPSPPLAAVPSWPGVRGEAAPAPDAVRASIPTGRDAVDAQDAWLTLLSALASGGLDLECLLPPREACDDNDTPLSRRGSRGEVATGGFLLRECLRTWMVRGEDAVEGVLRAAPRAL